MTVCVISKDLCNRRSNYKRKDKKVSLALSNAIANPQSLCTILYTLSHYYTSALLQPWALFRNILLLTLHLDIAIVSLLVWNEREDNAANDSMFEDLQSCTLFLRLATLHWLRGIATADRRLGLWKFPQCETNALVYDDHYQFFKQCHAEQDCLVAGRERKGFVVCERAEA